MKALRGRAARPGRRDCASHGYVRERTMREARSQVSGANARRLRDMNK